MAPFTPYEEANRAPRQYEPREPSGPQANTAWGDLLGGIAKTLSGGIRGFDEATKEVINKDAYNDTKRLKDESIGEYRSLVGNALQASYDASGKPGEAPTASSTNGATGPTDEYNNPISGPPNGSTGASRPIPPAIGIKLRDLDKMNQATHNGQFDSERFYGEAQQITANLVSRFPGYSDYISAKVSSFLGTDPANAQREALQQSLKELIGGNKHQDAAAKWNTEVMTHYAPSMGGPWTDNALKAANNPEAQHIYRVQAAQQIAYEHGLKTRTAELGLLTASNTATEEAVTKDAVRNIDAKFGQMQGTTILASSGWKGTVNDVMENLRLQSASGKVDIEQNQKMALAIGNQRQAFQSYIEQEWIKPRFNPNKDGAMTDSYSTLIKDQGAKAAMLKKYDTMYESLQQYVGAGLFSLATTVADMSTRQTDSVVAEMFKNKAAVVLSAAPKVFGPAYNDILSSANLQSNWKLITGFGADLLKGALTNTMVEGVNGGANTLLTQRDKWGQSAQASVKGVPVKPPPAYLNGLMENQLEILRNPSTNIPVEVRANAAEVISHPDTPIFLDGITKEQQFKAYGNLFAPDVTKFIKDHKATEIWNRYKETAGQSFAITFNNFANDLKVAGTNDYRGTYKWNETTQQIDYIPSQSFGQAPDRNSNPAKSAMAVVNQGLRTYAGVLAADGEKITPDHLTALGINLGERSKNPTFNEMMDTLKNKINAVLPGKDSTKRPEGVPATKKREITVPEDRPTPPASPSGDRGNDTFKDKNGREFIMRDGKIYPLVEGP